jgi:hypothetical protein
MPEGQPDRHACLQVREQLDASLSEPEPEQEQEQEQEARGRHEVPSLFGRVS